MAACGPHAAGTAPVPATIYMHAPAAPAPAPVGRLLTHPLHPPPTRPCNHPLCLPPADALSQLGAFYQKAGPRARLSDDVRELVLQRLAEAEAALPAWQERGSILGL